MIQKINIITNRTDGHVDFFYLFNVGFYRLTLCEPPYKSKAAWLSTLVIDENNREDGFGNHLLAHAEEQAKKMGRSAISLEVVWGSWGRDWYERKGFVVVAEGINEDMVVMTKFI